MFVVKLKKKKSKTRGEYKYCPTTIDCSTKLDEQIIYLSVQNMIEIIHHSSEVILADVNNKISTKKYITFVTQFFIDWQQTSNTRLPIIHRYEL